MNPLPPFKRLVFMLTLGTVTLVGFDFSGSATLRPLVAQDVAAEATTSGDFGVGENVGFSQDMTFPSDAEFQMDQDIDFDMEGLEDFGPDFGPPEISAEAQAAAGVLFLVFVLVAVVACVVGLVLTGLVAYWLMDALNAIPEPHRQMSPMVPWLLFVPLVQIVVLLLAFIKVPDSLSSYLRSMDDSSHGDCGKSNGLWGAILYLLGCTFPIGLVMLFLSLKKIHRAKLAARAFQ